MDITKKLVNHAANLKYEDIPKRVVDVQKKSIADAIGCMIAASGESENISAFFSVAKELGGGGNCTVFADGTKTTPMMAALANGALAHALDFEDSHEMALLHPNAVSTPAMIALAEHFGNISGKKFLSALIVASDIACRLDLGVNEDLLKYGWNMPPIHEGMGAVMGAGNLLGLSEDEIQDAIAMNMSQVTSSGQAANSGKSVIRTVRDGFSAQASVLSALLAKKGISARFEEAFEGKLGYYHAYARDNYTPEKVIDKLGKTFQSEYISFKPWPCCRATHTTVEGLQKMMAEHTINVEEIQEIHIVMHEIGKMVVEPNDIKYHPTTVAIAKFSIPFVVGTLLKYGEVNLQSFTAERLKDSEIIKLGSLVTYEIDTSLKKEENKITVITIKTKRGDFKSTMNFPLGCIENPMDNNAMISKFKSCMHYSKKKYTDEQIEKIFDMINHIEELDDVCKLFELF